MLHQDTRMTYNLIWKSLLLMVALYSASKCCVNAMICKITYWNSALCGPVTILLLSDNGLCFVITCSNCSHRLPHRKTGRWRPEKSTPTSVSAISWSELRTPLKFSSVFSRSETHSGWFSRLPILFDNVRLALIAKPMKAELVDRSVRTSAIVSLGFLRNRIIFSNNFKDDQLWIILPCLKMQGYILSVRTKMWHLGKQQRRQPMAVLERIFEPSSLDLPRTVAARRYLHNWVPSQWL